MKMDVLELINKERKAKGVKVSELAEHCAVSATQMSNYLNGKNKMPLQVGQHCIEYLGLSLIVGSVIK